MPSGISTSKNEYEWTLMCLALTHGPANGKTVWKPILFPAQKPRTMRIYSSMQRRNKFQLYCIYRAHDTQLMAVVIEKSTYETFTPNKLLEWLTLNKSRLTFGDMLCLFRRQLKLKRERKSGRNNRDGKRFNELLHTCGSLCLLFWNAIVCDITMPSFRESQGIKWVCVCAMNGDRIDRSRTVQTATGA